MQRLSAEFVTDNMSKEMEPVIPFSPPFIDEDVVNEIVETLHSGWITTGKKVKELEETCVLLSSCEECLCVNSWTSGAQLVLKWWGVGPGDEVIVPVYTYAATALVVLHAGATPVMVDVLDDFTMDPEKVRQAITPRTKAIIPVDVGGWPCNYEALQQLVQDPGVVSVFQPNNDWQQKLGRILLISDAAHSIGAQYGSGPSARCADIAVYSFHAVKNITTGEGGAICLNLPAPIDNREVWQWMKINSLNGQTKDAFAKAQTGNWRYDIVSLGLKINMPDIAAAIGLSQARRYTTHLLPERRRVFEAYQAFFSQFDWAQLPPQADFKRTTAYHLFPLRIRSVSEAQRDAIIEKIATFKVAVNVHFIPLPMLSVFKERGFRIEDFPSAYDQYSRVITLPIYPQLTGKEIERVTAAVVKSYLSVIHSMQNV